MGFKCIVMNELNANTHNSQLKSILYIIIMVSAQTLLPLSYNEADLTRCPVADRIAMNAISKRVVNLARTCCTHNSNN